MRRACALIPSASQIELNENGYSSFSSSIHRAASVAALPTVAPPVPILRRGYDMMGEKVIDCIHKIRVAAFSIWAEVYLSLNRVIYCIITQDRIQVIILEVPRCWESAIVVGKGSTLAGLVLPVGYIE